MKPIESLEHTTIIDEVVWKKNINILIGRGACEQSP